MRQIKFFILNNLLIFFFILMYPIAEIILAIMREYYRRMYSFLDVNFYRFIVVFIIIFGILWAKKIYKQRERFILIKKLNTIYLEIIKSLSDKNLKKTILISNLIRSMQRTINLSAFSKRELRKKTLDFYAMDLSDVHLAKSDLRGVNLSKTDLTNTDLSESDLCGSNLTFSKAINANLTNALLRNANLKQANFTNANLTNVDLKISCFLLFLSFKKPSLEGANLSNATLGSTNLKNVNLTKTNLEGAHLSDTKNLTQRQINNAIVNEYTEVPKHIKLKLEQRNKKTGLLSKPYHS